MLQQYVKVTTLYVTAICESNHCVLQQYMKVTTLYITAVCESNLSVCYSSM
jgi:hypothetical protein